MLAILQFDAASVSVLERLLREGRLPALAGLRERGRWHRLETRGAHFSAAVHPTLYSGTEVGEHGLFYPFQWSAAEQRIRYTSAFDAPPNVWERLAGAGRRALVIDAYESRPARAPVGVYLNGWQLKNRVVLPRQSAPRQVHRSLKRRFGGSAAAEETFGRPSARGLLRLRDRLAAAPKRVADAASHLLTHDSFDLAWLGFNAAHFAGHMFWDLSQVEDEELDDSARSALDDAMADVYAAVDTAIDRVVAALPEDTDVIVLSPLGMDVNTSRTDLLPEMLDAVLHGGTASRKAAGSIWRLRAALPTDLRGRVAGALPDRLALELTARLELRGTDWGSTRAFAHPADNQGYVRLNLRGREREGIVRPAEADALIDQISAGLATFRDPDGTPSVKDVERVSGSLYTGARAGRLPDLVVRWSDRPATRLEGVSSPDFGEIRRRGGASGRSGNHTEGDAWALVVPGASRHRDPGRPPRLVDIAATAVGGAGTDGVAGEPLLEPA